MKYNQGSIRVLIIYLRWIEDELRIQKLFFLLQTSRQPWTSAQNSQQKITNSHYPFYFQFRMIGMKYFIYIKLLYTLLGPMYKNQYAHNIHCQPNVLPQLYEKIDFLMLQRIALCIQNYFAAQIALQDYRAQIQILITYNKGLVQILNEFQSQEDKLIKRLRRLEEINIQYMSQYCQAKGKEFTMPNLPEHKSIFCRINLENFEYKKNSFSQERDEYKNEIKKILLRVCLKRQDFLLEKVQKEMDLSMSKQEKTIFQAIRQKIQLFHLKLGQANSENVFNLYYMQSDIQEDYNKVKRFTDSQGGSPGSWLGDSQVIKNLVKANVIPQEVDKSVLLMYLQDYQKLRRLVYEEYQKQRSSQNSFSLQLEKIDQQSVERKQDHFENERKYYQSAIQRLKQELQWVKRQMEINVQDYQRRIKNLQKEKENQSIQVKNLSKQIQQKKIQVQQLKSLLMKSSPRDSKLRGNKNIRPSRILQSFTKQTQTQPYNLKHCFQSTNLLFSVNTNPSTELQTKTMKKIRESQEELFQKSKLNSEESRLKQQIQLLISQYELKIEKMVEQHQLSLYEEKKKLTNQNNQKILMKDNIIRKYEQRLRALGEQANLENQKLLQNMKKCKMDYQSLEKQKDTVQKLAISVYEAIGLTTEISLNGQIKKKLESIKAKLKDYIQKYQKQIKWNIECGKPEIMQNLSLMTIINTSNDNELNQQFSLDQIDHKMYKNIKKSKSKPRNILNHIDSSRRKLPSNQLENQIYFEENQVCQKKNLSEEQKSYKDDYQNLMVLHRQVLVSLQQEENKNKEAHLQFQRYMDLVYSKQKADPIKFSLQNQLAYLTMITLEQKETIEAERRSYNEIFKNYCLQSQSKISGKLSQLRSKLNDVKAQNNKYSY